MSGIEARFAGRLGGFMLDAAFSLPGTGITGLFGPSGCGKTSLLRCLAGLTRLPDGFLRVNDEIWQDGDIFLAPQHRRIGYVFQDSRLFAHLTVRRNLQFGLRRAVARGIGEAEVVGLLGLEPLLQRYPARLSGGERQRVAIGRALLAQPRLLLLDEPLAALDRAAANQILPKLREISQLFAVPVLHVSHDIVEIERIADGLVLMRQDGRVAACGQLAGMLTDLSLPFARQRDAAVVLEMTAGAHDAAYGLTSYSAGGVTLTLPGQPGAPGAAVRLRIRASDVSLARQRPDASSILNILPARIVEAETAAGPHVNLVLGIGGAASPIRLLSAITRKSWDALGLSVGEVVYAQIKAVALAESR
ncbi:molybdenum ABC transporter ATP-binding protein [Acidocella sp.]|uniref:molybdenum ABC transporter ATP-binding protein n=1 Tax=Acidocella sp. TaxID=50710 RepID=UPI002625A93A|nr:molybdenum ABC transporter ATP-binding protein [Acidocella sp.]